MAINETPGHYALHIDRGSPVGVSEVPSTPGRTALWTKIKNDPTDPVPVYFVELGEKLFFDATEIDTTPGSIQTLIATTVPAGKIRKLKQLNGHCFSTGKLFLKANNVIKAVLNFDAASPNNILPLNEREFAAGTVITVEFESIAAMPVRKISAFLCVVDQTI